MSARSWRIVGWCSSLLVAATMAPAQPPSNQPAQEVMRLGLRGVYFVENAGQWSDETVCYGLKSRGLDVDFRESSFTMHLSREVSDPAGASQGKGFAPPRISLLDAAEPTYKGIRGGEDFAPAYEHLTLTITFPGSNPVTPRGAQPQAARFNYFVGGEGRGIASNVPSFGAVIYENLYDGIDLHVMGNDDGVMKYEFHCAPGADYTQIRIRYDGIDSLCVNEDGDLEIATSFGMLRDRAPIVWQEDADSTSRAAATSRAREEAVLDVEREAPLPDRRGSSDPTIPARFELVDAQTYRIALDGEVDPTRVLIIDPVVEWMYYLGGRGDESGYDIAVDCDGNALVAGDTHSLSFAGRNNSPYGGSDAFALKVSPSGQLQWMTYLGGSSVDGGYGIDIAVDGAGNALVTGDTSSTDFAGRSNSYYGGYADAFALKVSPSGQLQWMIYLGGSGEEYGHGIAVDIAGNALVAGSTYSRDFAGRNNSRYGAFDAFALKVSASGELQWMTYLGGNGIDSGYGIAVDGAGNALVTGWASSISFAGRINSHHGGTADAFALKVSLSGELLWMTYLGGSGDDYGYGIAVDGAGNALLTGETDSTDFEGRNNAYHGGIADAFALKVSPSGQLHWMTDLGGSRYESGWGIAVDGAGNALVTGGTYSRNFGGRNNSYYGGFDAFALKVCPLGQLQSMTYLGGRNLDFGRGIAVDTAGNLWITGGTDSPDFAGRSNSYYGGRHDAFIVKLRLDDGPQLTVAATCPSGGPIRIEWSGASPGGQVALIFARNTGSFTIPQQYPCAGTTLGLGANQIQLAFQGGAGQEGSRTLNASTGPGACGGYLQLLDLTTCATSNVPRIE